VSRFVGINYHAPRVTHVIVEGSFHNDSEWDRTIGSLTGTSGGARTVCGETFYGVAALVTARRRITCSDCAAATADDISRAETDYRADVARQIAQEEQDYREYVAENLATVPLSTEHN
jgi:hypothetical protein